MSDLVIEVTSTDGESGDLSGWRAAPELFRRRKNEIADSLAEISEALQQRLDRISRPGNRWGLDEVSIQLGLAVQADAGVVITRTAVGATLQATLTWRVADKPEQVSEEAKSP